MVSMYSMWAQGGIGVSGAGIPGLQIEESVSLRGRTSGVFCTSFGTRVEDEDVGRMMAMLHFVQVDFLIFVPLLRARFCSATQRYPAPGVSLAPQNPPLASMKPSSQYEEERDSLTE